MYLVIEIEDRALQGIHPVKDRKTAVETANKLMEANLTALSGPPDQTQTACPSNEGAWYDAKGVRWDAHIAFLPEANNALLMLLEDLCGVRMSTDDSPCARKACTMCPVETVRALIKDASA